eukprot:scaffold49399_cov62-Attheya_sp.AAC.1
MINLSGDARSLRVYRLHVKVCDDEDLLKDKYDDQFSGLLFFIGGINMGQAPHLKTPIEILPIHADQLFNLGEDGDECCKVIENKRTNPKLVKNIQAVYRVLLTAKQGVVQELCSWYDPSSFVQVPNPPSPPSKSSSLASLKTSNTAAAPLTASARRAMLSAEITTNISLDAEGLPDLDDFWKASALAVKGMYNDLPPGWPACGAKPDDEAHAAYNLAHRAAELNEAATKACAANIAEEELQKETHKKADVAAILAEVKATPVAVVADAEATKSANIAALAAYAATEKTKIAEDEANARHVQEKATAPVLSDAEVTKAAEDEAAAKLIQEKAAAAVLADAEVTKAANIAKAAEDEAAAKLVQEKAAAAAAAAKLVQEKAAAAVTKAANIAKTAEDHEAAAKLVQEKAAAAAAAAKLVQEKAAAAVAAAKLVQEKAATAAVLADAEVIKVANIAAALAKAAEDEAPAKLGQEKAAGAAVFADEEATTAAPAKLVEVKAALAAEETTKAIAANVAERLAVDEAAAKAMEEDLLQSLQQTVSSDSHISDTKTDSDTSPQDPSAHAGKDDATAEL